jgi:hypothetical protein
MNSVQVFSREYLQGLPEQRKQDQIDNIVQSFRQEIINVAAAGKTSYMYVRPDSRKVAHCHPPLPVLTNEDLIAGFQTRFPGCKVSYEESWVKTATDTQVLKSGIVIDWF